VRSAHARRLICAAAIGLLACACAIPLPRIPHAEPTIPPLPQTSRIYDSQGRYITDLHADQNRTIVPISDIPVPVRDAVVAVEDQRFYEHAGVDVKAIIRAAVQNAKEGRIVQGGSTITEQLVKNTITGDERTLSRKIKDAVLAFELEKRYTKDQILAMYLNTVYFGQGAYGIEAAADSYFSIPPNQLTLAEGALLAGLIASPSTYDPVFHPDQALRRRNLVLSKMLEQEWIDQPTYVAARAQDLGLNVRKPAPYPAAFFVDYVKQWFLANPAFGATYADRYAMLFEGGLRITTTVDLRLQREAEQAVNGILTFKSDPWGAMTVLDPRTGAVLAMVGGRDYFGNSKIAKLNLATGGATGRQAGSSFKPFALVTALNEGISPEAIYAAPSHIDIPLPRGYSPPIWPVDNYDGEAGGMLTLEQATIHSVNTVYAQLIMQEGAANVVNTAHRMGITSPLHAFPSAVLGANEVNTLEMASAYGSLATLGNHAPPLAVWRITDAAGKPIYQADPQPEQAVNAGVAWTTTQILEKVVQQGTGVEAILPRPVAGKTGTAQNWTNAWFVGYIPQMVAAVWVGFPQGQISMTSPRVRLPHVLGGTWPAEIWHAFMVKATAGMPVMNWRKPDIQFVSVAVDETRGGCLPTRWTLPTAIRRISFYDGTQPTHRCSQPSGPQLIAVPSVIGWHQANAERVLGSYAYSVSVSTEESATAPAGTVISESPPAGSMAYQGTTVSIVVATAPPPGPAPPTVVPDVVGMTQSDAVLALAAAGFSVQVTTQWECDPHDSCGAVAGQVWLETPPGGAIADPNSTVIIWVNPSG
jgi:penicillin-binding protein 1A